MSPQHQPVTRADILQKLKRVEDPEMPVSIMDLGIVRDVEVDGKGAVTVTLMPTFSGCPALEMIESRVKDALREQFDLPLVKVKWAFDGQWTADMITPEGKEALKAFGIALAQGDEKVQCPYCHSENVRRESFFGCSLCREFYYCKNCKNPFEKIKKI